jgi:hypothetical protein
MNAIPTPAGNASTSFLQASRPPAEAPIPTTGNSAGPPAGHRNVFRFGNEGRLERGRSLFARRIKFFDISHPQNAGSETRLPSEGPLPRYHGLS